jgi:hypothetical protein
MREKIFILDEEEILSQNRRFFKEGRKNESRAGFLNSRNLHK